MLGIPEGSDTDPSGTPTIAGLSSQTHQIVLPRIGGGGVPACPGSIRYVHAVGPAGRLDER